MPEVIDPTGLDEGWHTTQSLKSLTGGGLTGQGLFNGNRTQAGALSAQHTDFIFSSIGEELGYVGCVEEFTAQAKAQGISIGHIVSATGSGGTTAGLLLGAKLFCPDIKVTGMGVDDDPFEEIVPDLAARAAEILGTTLERTPNDFEMVYHLGSGYAIPNREDTPYLEELARLEGILLDPVYTGKAWAGMLKLLEQGYFDEDDNILFVHTGGAAALFALDLG